MLQEWILSLKDGETMSEENMIILGKGSKKKRERSGQADRLGRPPPLPRSGQENVKNSRQVVIFGVILPFYKG